MNIPTKKLQNGFEMPVFGLGTWEMGGRMERDTTNDQHDIAAIKRAIEAGITHIDSAEKYAQGHAEELVGEAIREYDRKKLFLVTKIAENHLHYSDVFSALNASLERLRTNYVDLYMIHGPSLTIPIDETMKALNEIQQKGLAKHIAVSNFTVERLKKAQSVSKAPIVAGQYHLNLQFREAERKGIVEYVKQKDIMFIAWRPVQKGLFAQIDNPLMTDLCKKYGKTPSQIAINWLISQKNIVTLSKMSSEKHLDENLSALNWTMEQKDIDQLDKNFPNQRDISDAVPLLD